MKHAIMMICLLMASATINAEQSYGEHSGGDSMRDNAFSQFKQVIINGLQQRINLLQSVLSCVQAARSHDETRSCQEKAHQSMEALKTSQEQEIKTLR